jgi:hypothetical protein
VAAELKVRIGDPIVVAGSTLTLAGTFDPDRLDLEWRSLDGQSLSPFDLGMAGDDEPFASPQLTDVAATVSAEGEKEGPRISGRDLIILPASLVRSAGGTLRSIGIQPKSSALPSEIARNLARVLALPIYYADDRAAVNVIVATPLAPRFPRNLWVPLLMAALIVFNTMLNSVAERKGEIHIYSSLGLAPSHVGMLFVAEALTYGLLGSLFGYVAGQGLATVLTRYDLMGGVVLNYSGTNAILTMGMVLIVVALSAIVPAVMAGRLAAPGESVSWRLPPPTGGVIRDILPFMVTRETAPGLMAFIHEYLDAHKEGALGHFAADAIRVLPPEGDRVAGLEATVWVEPYDLGVRQTLRLEVKPRLENMCGVHMELAHRSGPTGTWQRLNKSFVAELRRQFLGWRRVPPDRVIQYITESRA